MAYAESRSPFCVANYMVQNTECTVSNFLRFVCFLLDTKFISLFHHLSGTLCRRFLPEILISQILKKGSVKVRASTTQAATLSQPLSGLEVHVPHLCSKVTQALKEY